MDKLITIVLGLALGVGVVLGFMWLVWLGWTWALPQVWPTGPQGLIQPGYWLFVVCWLLASLLGGAVFGRSRSKD